MKLVALGTFDTGKPRMRILLRGLKENGVDVTICHETVWGGIEDKSQITGIGPSWSVVRRLLVAYPKLMWRYSRLPPHDVVLIGYFGLFDLLVLWPFMKLRRIPIAWDTFLSLYNTVVEDRKIIGRGNPLGWMLYGLEWLGLRLATKSIIDTEAHAQYLRDTYHCPPQRVCRVFVGAEPEAFNIGIDAPARISDTMPFCVLFYGQFVPLHGIDTIVRAAKLGEGKGIRWLLIGKGQEADNIRQLIDTLKPSDLSWIEWVEYQELIVYLNKSHVALGIFGDTDKAARVIPNKVFQILSAGRPLITRDSPAMRELLDVDDPHHLMIPPGDPEALLAAVLKMRTSLALEVYPVRMSSYQDRISPGYCGHQLVAILSEMLRQKA